MKKRGKMREKRGQITIFIILGLILLLALGYFIFVREKAFMEVEQIDPEYVPVKSFVETCLYNLGRDALDILGLNGGYIYFPPDIENDPNSYISTSPTPRFKNPYWWHDGIERVPTEEFMEDQISQYVENNMPDCLSEFGAFSAVYDVIEHSNLEVSVEAGESMESLVKIYTDYSIEIKDKFNKTLAEIKDFDVEIPVRLHAIYTLATSIMDVENAQGFVERKVIDLITMDEEIPDTGGPEFKCGKLSWRIPDILGRIKTLMMVNFDFIKIKGTNFPADRYVPLPDDGAWDGLADTYNSSYYWNHYIFDVGDEDWSDMRVSFSYDYNWELPWQQDFYIRPNDYPLLYSNSQQGQGMLNHFCMHIWHFTYDLKFPVKVTIMDEKISKNNDYTFIFAFQGSIDHNEPKRESFTSIDYEVENFVTDEEFCEDNFSHVLIFASENTSAGWEIKDVNLTYECGRFRCPLGLTKPYYDEEAGTPFWEGEVPYCTMALLKAKKEGYSDTQKFIQTNQEEAIHKIFMDPIKEFKNFTVLKHQLIAQYDGTQYLGQRVSPIGQELTNGESAMIVLSAKEKNFEKTILFSGNETIAEGVEGFSLLAGDDYTYDIDITIMNDDGIIGGYSGEMEVSKGDVRYSNAVKLHAVYRYFSDDLEAALFYSGLSDYSNYVMEPEFIR